MKRGWHFVYVRDWMPSLGIRYHVAIDGISLWLVLLTTLITPIAAYPLGTRAVQVPDSLAVSRFLEAFGRADRVQTCACERNADASVSQALHLNNGQTLNDKLRSEKSIVSAWLVANLKDDEIVDRLFLMALSRRPTTEEKTKFAAILNDAAKDGAKAHREAIEDFVWAVLTGREFLFNH